ncbi:MAG: hypothetical protein ABJE95_32690, partial [Byssovorax sp.]
LEDRVSDDFVIGENADGKYFLIEVPNFNNGSDDEADGNPKMTSYLRLGAVKDASIAGKEHAPKESGEDLAYKVRRVTRIDGVVPEEGSAQRSLPFRTQDLVFEDDYRERDPAAPITNVMGETLEVTELGITLDSEAEELEGTRLAETKLLHTKGGWRDHSDGNRITTTRGDKVEVIRGNYKLVVMGRQDDFNNASGWDLSGGEMRGTTLNLGEFETTSVEWVEDDAGRWRVVEKNQKGDSFSIYWGNVHEEFFGEIKSDVTGSETPGSYPHAVPGSPPPSKPSKVNPKIIERTWAESIEGYTGSSKLRIPTIKEETWAVTTSELTDVTGNTTETTTIGGSTIGTTTVLGATMETTTVGGATMETTVVGGATLETTVVGGAAIGVTAVGLAKIEATVVGIAKIEATAAPILLDAKASLLSIDLAATILAIEVFLGKKIDVHLLDTYEVQLVGKTEVDLMKEEIATMKTEMHGQASQIAAVCDNVMGQYSVIGAIISLL